MISPCCRAARNLSFDHARTPLHINCLQFVSSAKHKKYCGLAAKVSFSSNALSRLAQISKHMLRRIVAVVTCADIIYCRRAERILKLALSSAFILRRNFILSAAINQETLHVHACCFLTRITLHSHGTFLLITPSPMSMLIRCSAWAFVCECEFLRWCRWLLHLRCTEMRRALECEKNFRLFHHT